MPLLQTLAAEGEGSSGGASTAVSRINGKALDQIIKYHPCFDVMTGELARVCLDFEKSRQLLSKPRPRPLSPISPALVGARYIVISSAASLGERWDFVGSLPDNGTARRIASSEETFNSLEDALKGAEACGRNGYFPRWSSAPLARTLKELFPLAGWLPALGLRMEKAVAPDWHQGGSRTPQAFAGSSICEPALIARRGRGRTTKARKEMARPSGRGNNGE
jgi:hypothetical protein